MRIPAILSAIALVLTCASPPALAQRSVDEAVRVIDSFRGTQQPGSSQAATPVSFVPPPRTIADITAILDRQKPDPAKRAAQTAIADRAPPTGGPRNELVDFYFQRAVVASELGRAQQYLDDMKQAYDIAAALPNFPARRLIVFVQHIGFGHQRNGDINGAIEALQRRAEMTGRLETGPAQGTLINTYFNLVLTLIGTGQVDRAREALAKLEKASTDVNPRTPQDTRDDWRAQLYRSQAAVARETGRYADAEKLLRQTLEIENALVPREATTGLPPGTYANRRDSTLADLANVLVRQGRLVEGEAEMRRSLLNRLERNGRYHPSTAGDMIGLSRVLFEQGRYPEAEKLADAARDAFENIGHGQGSSALAQARRWIATAQVAQGRYQEAREIYAAIERDVGDRPGARRVFLDNNFNYAVVLMRTGEARNAQPIFERVVEGQTKNLGEKAYATAQSRAWLATSMARMGQTDAALKEFEAAMPILLSSSRESDSDDDGSSVGQRDRMLQVAVENYLGLLADTKGSAAAVETFRLADAVRGQSVQRALAASSARAAASDPRLANLVRYEQDAQKQAAALQGLLTNMLTRPTSEQDPKAVQKLREDIDKLRTARARLREEIERAFPDYVNLIDPRPATVEQAQKSLRPGEALIATYAGSDRLFVWAIPHQGAPAYASTKIADTEIEKLVGDLRKALDPNASTLEEVPAFDVATAHKLYELILKPIEAGWKDAKSLMIVPHKALGQLPAALLVTENVPQPAKGNVFFAEYKNVPFLARKVAVTQLPSVNALATLRALPVASANRQNFVAFGDPWFSPEQATEAKAQQVAALTTRGRLVRRNAPKTDIDSAELAMLPRLPDTADEVKSIALALRADVAKDVFIGSAANEKTVKTMDLANRKVVMFATHGLVPGDLNGLTQPALALSAPKVADVDGDGLLTMEEVLALKLNADWVVLSACNTATGSGAGAEAVSGLGRAFFYAGTRALLVSNWPVETTSARILTTDLFRRQAEDAKLARGEAMRQAMVALIDSPGATDEATKQPMFSYAHPIFWAPFSVVGDGG